MGREINGEKYKFKPPQLSVMSANPLVKDIHVRVSEKMFKYILGVQDYHKIKTRAETLRYILACGLSGAPPLNPGEGEGYDHRYPEAMLERSEHYAVVE